MTKNNAFAGSERGTFVPALNEMMAHVGDQRLLRARRLKYHAVDAATRPKSTMLPGSGTGPGGVVLAQTGLFVDIAHNSRLPPCNRTMNVSPLGSPPKFIDVKLPWIESGSINMNVLPMAGMYPPKKLISRTPPGTDFRTPSAYRNWLDWQDPRRKCRC